MSSANDDIPGETISSSAYSSVHPLQAGNWAEFSKAFLNASTRLSQAKQLLVKREPPYIRKPQFQDIIDAEDRERDPYKIRPLDVDMPPEVNQVELDDGTIAVRRYHGKRAETDLKEDRAETRKATSQYRDEVRKLWTILLEKLSPEILLRVTQDATYDALDAANDGEYPDLLGLWDLCQAVSMDADPDDQYGFGNLLQIYELKEEQFEDSEVGFESYCYKFGRLCEAYRAQCRIQDPYFEQSTGEREKHLRFIFFQNCRKQKHQPYWAHYQTIPKSERPVTLTESILHMQSFLKSVRRMTYGPNVQPAKGRYREDVNAMMFSKSGTVTRKATEKTTSSAMRLPPVDPARASADCFKCGRLDCDVKGPSCKVSMPSSCKHCTAQGIRYNGSHREEYHNQWLEFRARNQLIKATSKAPAIPPAPKSTPRESKTPPKSDKQTKRRKPKAMRVEVAHGPEYRRATPPRDESTRIVVDGGNPPRTHDTSARRTLSFAEIRANALEYLRRNNSQPRSTIRVPVIATPQTEAKTSTREQSRPMVTIRRGVSHLASVADPFVPSRMLECVGRAIGTRWSIDEADTPWRSAEYESIARQDEARRTRRAPFDMPDLQPNQAWDDECFENAKKHYRESEEVRDAKFGAKGCTCQGHACGSPDINVLPCPTANPFGYTRARYLRGHEFSSWRAGGCICESPTECYRLLDTFPCPTRDPIGHGRAVINPYLRLQQQLQHAGALDHDIVDPALLEALPLEQNEANAEIVATFSEGGDTVSTDTNELYRRKYGEYPYPIEDVHESSPLTVPSKEDSSLTISSEEDEGEDEDVMEVDYRDVDEPIPGKRKREKRVKALMLSVIHASSARVRALHTSSRGASKLQLSDKLMNTRFVLDSGCVGASVVTQTSARQLIDNLRHVTDVTIMGATSNKKCEWEGELPLVGLTYFAELNTKNLLSLRALVELGLEYYTTRQTLTVYEPSTNTPILEAEVDREGFHCVTYADLVAGAEKLKQIRGMASMLLVASTVANPAALTLRAGDDIVLPNSDNVHFTADELARAKRALLLHATEGHPSDEVLIRKLDQNMGRGCDLTSQDVRNMRRIYGRCIACHQGKATFPRGYDMSQLPYPAHPGFRIHCDLKQLTERTIGGNIWCIIAICERTDYVDVVMMPNKKAKTIAEAVGKMIDSYSRYGHKVRQIVSDPEQTLKALQPHLDKYQVEVVDIIPGVHERKVERSIRTLLEKERTMLASLPYKLPYKLYGELRSTAAMLYNNTPTSNTNDATPCQLKIGVKPLMVDAVFGQPGLFYRSTPKDHPLQPNADVGIVVGFNRDNRKKYRVYLNDTNNLVVRGKFVPISNVPASWHWPDNELALANRVDMPTDDNEETIRETSDEHTNGAATTIDSRLSLNEDSEIDGGSIPTDQPVQEGMTRVSLRPPGITRSPKIVAFREASDPSPVTRPTTNDSAVKERTVTPVKRRNVNEVANVDSNYNANTKTNVTNEDDYFTRLISYTPHSPSTTITPRAKRPLSEILGRDNAEDEAKKLRSPISPVDVQNELASNEAMEVARDEHTSERPISKMESLTTTEGNAQPNPKRMPLDAERSTRIGRHVRLPSRFSEYQLKAYSVSAHQFELATRVSVKKALKSHEYRDSVIEAIQNEFENMRQMNVFEVVKYDSIPTESKRSVIPLHMFLKWKWKADGQFDKVKARLVANGDRQPYDTFDETESPTVNPISVFTLLNIAAVEDLECAVFDLKGAFLLSRKRDHEKDMYGMLTGEVAELMTQLYPETREFVHNNGFIYIKLLVYIYGLKQAARMFLELLRAKLKQIGYTQTIADECLFTKPTEDGRMTVVGTHVDDLLVVGPDNREIAKLRSHLETFAEINEQARDKFSYIGLSVTRNREQKIMHVSQTQFFQKILEIYEPEIRQRRVITTPMDPNAVQSLCEDSENAIPVDVRKYLSGVMKLMYLARFTRPDILFAVTYLAGKASSPTQLHYDAFLRIIVYLKREGNMSAVFSGDTLRVKIHCDASHGVHHDGKGHTGFVITLGTSPIFFHSGKQKTVALHSTDAETIAVVEVLTYVLWLRVLLGELGFDIEQPIPIEQDSQSAMLLYKGGGKFRRSKHMIVKYHFIKQLIDENIVVFNYTQSLEMLADPLTKPVPAPQLRHMLDQLSYVRDMMST